MEPDGPELFASWQAMVRVCDRVLESRDDAEDCASDALLQAFADGMDDVENVEAWLVSVAKKRAFDVLRRRVRTRRQLLRLASRHDVSDPDPAERVADEAEARWLSQRADELLTAPARAVLRVVAEGGSVNDAASTLAMTRRSAESHLHRARLMLRAARVAIPAFGVALVRAARRPATASSMVLVAGVAVVAPVYLSPGTPERPNRTVVQPMMGEVTQVTPELGDVVSRTTSAGFGAASAGPRVVAGVRTTPARKRDVANVTTPRVIVDMGYQDRRGPDDPVGIVKDCLEHLEVSVEKIGC